MGQTEQVTHKMHRWKFGDLIFGVIIPTLVALLIVGLSLTASPAFIGLRYILLEAIVVVSVPLLIGLIWNQWAGGASGFLLGSLYSLYFADQLYVTQGRGDISLVGNLVSAMLIGYVAGALNKHSDSYKRMIVSGIVAGVMGAVVVVFASNYSAIVGPATLEGSLLSFTPRVLAGVLVPFVASAFLRHGRSPPSNH